MSPSESLGTMDIREGSPAGVVSPAYFLAYFTSLSPATLCQLFYALAAAAVLAVAATPDSARQLLTRYGARASAGGTSGEKAARKSDDGLLVKIISWVTSVGQVPHSWFIHFYILSLSCSIFWAVQYIYLGSVLESIARKQASEAQNSMTINQVILVWFLMSLQGARRLYEYVAIIRPSSSKMWIVHWLLGNAFYLCTSVSIWIEGSTSIWNSDRKPHGNEAPSVNVILGVPIFLASWYMQHRCHRYLSGLKKYTLPEDGMFQYLVCPHYTCECLLYLSLAIMGAPEDHLYNKTLVCAVLFVSVNLGVTANGTKKWYGERFGCEKVQGKWKMIPGIF
ncbi:hypothetical protein F4779DRAFT_625162 [Xylariaceae sp. FL0662B]|nr:hypothetical protein F4779DRAFT_625162 [Xylariaceae sp. FL0662B]